MRALLARLARLRRMDALVTEVEQRIADLEVSVHDVIATNVVLRRENDELVNRNSALQTANIGLAARAERAELLLEQQERAR